MTSDHASRRPPGRQSRIHTLLAPSGWGLLLYAIGAGVLLALLDFLPPEAGWFADHPMTAQAVAGSILFIQGGLLLSAFLQYRDRERLKRITTVAYRALAQSANDAGRRMLAPLSGADLYELGIPHDDAVPGEPGSMVEADRARLRNKGFEVTFAEKGGSWGPQQALLQDRLPRLLEDPEFVRRMFRAASKARRDTQAQTAQWAPTMLTDGQLTEDLGRFRRMTDTLELLATALRSSGLLSAQLPDWTPPPGFKDRVANAFWEANTAYEEIRDEFRKLADLPSDAQVDRKASAES